VIAALMMIVVIQFLVVREQRKVTKIGEIEEGVIQTSPNESGSETDWKSPQVEISRTAEI
jgi:hypothetical protein